MLAILFAFISFIGWGVGDIFTTISSRKLGSFSTSFYGYFFGLLISLFYIPFALSTWKNFTLPMVLLTILLSIVQLFAFFAYNEGLKIGNSSLVGTIGGAFTSIVVILSLLFLGEKLSSLQIVSVIIIFIGLLFSSINFSDLKNKKLLLNKGTMFALFAMVGWSIYFTFIKLPVQQVGFFWPSFITSFVGTVSFPLFGMKRIKMYKPNIQSGFIAAFLCGVLLTIGSFSFNLAIGEGLSSIVAPIAGAYPALFALLAYFIFRDPISKQQKLGMAGTLFGIILLAYFSR